MLETPVITLTVNGEARCVETEAQTPLCDAVVAATGERVRRPPLASVDLNKL
jgi:hypothetical protein